MRKLIGGVCGFLAVSLAHAQGTTHTINYPGGDGTPYQVSGTVDTLDYFTPLPNAAAGGACSTAASTAQYYDQVVITNTGANTANVIFTLDDPLSAPGVCNFASGTNDRPRMTYYNVVFSPSAPQSGCTQIVEFAGSPSTICPQLSFSIPAGANNKATLLISTSRQTPPPRPQVLIDGVAGGTGLFGYHGGMGGSSPVTLQSFTVGQGP